MEARIVWILDQLGMGGAERLALRFAAAPLPWRIELVGLQAAPAAALEALWGTQLEPLRTRVHTVGIRGLNDGAGWWRLVQLLRRWRPLLVHTHLRYATIWGGAAARLLRRPYLTTVHLGPPPQESVRQRLIAAGERLSRRHAARVIYVSQAQKRAWGSVSARERAVVVGNGVALPAPAAGGTQLRRELGIAAAATVFTTVAVVRAAKGWRGWLQAVEQIAPQRPQARFVWVGGGPEWALLQHAVAASPARSQIVLPGASSNVAPWLYASDLFLFPSLEEAQPTAVMEAMAAGLPVIASDLPAVAEVLHGCGRLVRCGDVSGLAQAALAWSAPGSEAARVAGAAARQHAEGPLSERVWCEQISGLYENVLTQGSHR